MGVIVVDVIVETVVDVIVETVVDVIVIVHNLD